MVIPMGCGGSRADAIIEPRYHESWTRETESTWLTNTDVESPLSVANSKALDTSIKEKRMVNTGTQCGKQALTTTTTTTTTTPTTTTTTTSSSCSSQRRPRRSLSDVGVTGSSNPLVTPKGGHQRRPVVCLRMSSRSVSTIVEILNLETRVMKDEGQSRLCGNEAGQRQERFLRSRDGDLQK
ncbi:uncharacterized protein KZ484_007040 isoform 1-T1 [Pholidichthys leucotaenia]